MSRNASTITVLLNTHDHQSAQGICNPIPGRMCCLPASLVAEKIYAESAGSMSCTVWHGMQQVHAAGSEISELLCFGWSKSITYRREQRGSSSTAILITNSCAEALVAYRGRCGGGLEYRQDEEELEEKTKHSRRI